MQLDTKRCFVIFFCLAPLLRAQVSATLSGAVSDPSAALVSAAEVAAKNVDTGVIRETLTDGSQPL